jgi:hypothetical protein
VIEKWKLKWVFLLKKDINEVINFEEKGNDIPRPKRKPPVPAKAVKKAKGGKVSSSSSSSKYNCSNNRLY